MQLVKYNLAFLQTFLFIESLIIAYFSLIPGTELYMPGRGILEHFLAYFILGFLLERILSYDARKKYRIGLVLAIGFVFGLVLEIMQIFVPMRYASLFDMGVNGIGSLAGAMFSQLFFKMHYKFKKVQKSCHYNNKNHITS